MIKNIKQIKTRVTDLRRTLQNYSVVWLDGKFASKKDYSLEELGNIANHIYTFSEMDKCVNFLTNINDLRIFLIISNILAQKVTPLIHDLAQLEKIYIYAANDFLLNNNWSNSGLKVKGVYENILSICKGLKTDVKPWMQDNISLSFINPVHDDSIHNLNQIDPTFMYTQLFKEIFLELDFSVRAKVDFVQFLRDKYLNNVSKLKDIDEFERDYSPEFSIWWYTRESFIYNILNRSLRTLDSITMMKMGFFYV